METGNKRVQPVCSLLTWNQASFQCKQIQCSIVCFRGMPLRCLSINSGWQSQHVIAYITLTITEALYSPDPS